VSEQFSRRSAALIVDVDLDRLPDWEPGPLPLEHDGTVATRDARRGYFNERAAHALYGPGRVHRLSPQRHQGFEVHGVELLRVSDRRRTRNALLVVHANPAADGLELVQSLAQLADVGAARGWYDGLLDGAGRVGPDVRRAATLALVTPARRPEAPLPSAEYGAWTPELEWLWLLASATPPDTYRPPAEWAKPLGESLIRLSEGWKALVLRDGAAFLGSGPDIGAVYRLFPDAELHFRSIYLDSLLLGHIQRLRLSQIADDLAALGDAVRYPDRLRELELELAEFRNVFWWQQLGPHWHGNELLQAYQRQHEIEKLFGQVIGELQDYSRQAQTAAAQRTAALLGVLSVVGVPFGFAVGLTRAIGIEDWRWVALALLLAAAVSAAILTTHPGRTLIRPWRPGRRDERA
jgi:hypothetical protein